ncbi:TetR/AcrR family transcriptional regulator [Streptomyces fuscichromogenes]|uniref:TetR family transcriptional regulator n=1 Tax=Streptomyces fuscichromogenes TaxID=1324013 RepID=A0A917XF87_9ACTN|nr:TetR/AcrR family transcriptional regulator [Streptomyces fuscichromogenes]GGN19216.1 TetR family transcriptional regulator [Streptomyces fuscichromogenes]
MDISLTPQDAADRRVRRSRAALMGATLALVAERGTTNVPVSDIAQAADVSRQLVYQQFGDRETLLLETALELARRELLPHVGGPPEAARPGSHVLSAAQHFAEYRPFYRAMMTGPCAFALSKAMNTLFARSNQQLVHRMSAVPLDPGLAADLTLFVGGGWATVVSSWVVEAEDPLDPEAFAERLQRLVPVLLAAAGHSTVTEASGPGDAGGTGPAA